MSTTPYRTQAAIEIHKPQNTYGLIRAKAPEKPHECSLPGRLTRFAYWLIGRTIHPGSMFRCSCGYFYRLRQYSNHKTLSWDNVGRNGDGVQYWLELGGKYEKVERD